jgi:hypothetical protein
MRHATHATLPSFVENIKLMKDSQGRIILAIRRFTMPAQSQIDAFFDSLPEGFLTAEEHSLRQSLLSFLHRWQDRCSPTLTDAGKDPDIACTKRELLPFGIGIGVWMTRRMKEFEVTKQNEIGEQHFDLSSKWVVQSPSVKRQHRAVVQSS